jgi:bifunctional enzyme Fae/Hps
MKLLKPPYLQIALDLISYDSFIEIIKSIPFSEKILIEAGTPLMLI